MSPTQADLTRTLELFWHPVCTEAELDAAGPPGGADGRPGRGPLAVHLLGRDLVVAELADGTIAALDDRCLHRSTRLSVGWVDEDCIRCAYHGWAWDRSGRCVDIPALPAGPIPPKAVVGAYSTQQAYGLIWVRLDDRADTRIPACPADADDEFKVMSGEPYTWPVAAGRRVENFVDLSHFAWVHAGTLGRRDEPVPPLPDIARLDGELRFTYDPPADFDAMSSAMYGFSAYRMPIPCTVNIEFRLAGGARRMLWMTASPLAPDRCRSFWIMARTDDRDGDDEPHRAFQRIVLAEDEPVVCAQVPGELPLDAATELSVRTDKVSLAYRRWIRELVDATVDLGPAGTAQVLGRNTDAAAPSA